MGGGGARRTDNVIVIWRGGNDDGQTIQMWEQLKQYDNLWTVWWSSGPDRRTKGSYAKERRIYQEGSPINYYNYIDRSVTLCQ